MDHTVRLWDAEAGRQIGWLRGHAEGVTAVAVMVMPTGWEPLALVLCLLAVLGPAAAVLFLVFRTLLGRPPGPAPQRPLPAEETPLERARRAAPQSKNKNDRK